MSSHPTVRNLLEPKKTGMGLPHVSLGLHLQEATGPVHVCGIDLTARWSERPAGWPETPFTQTCALHPIPSDPV